MSKSNIVLIGMRGSGKTTLAKELANKLGKTFIDLDEEIERDENLSINEIVKKNGWENFRNIEQKICTIFGKKENQVIATGGGVIERDINIKNLRKNGFIVYLNTELKICAERVKNSNRPSLTGKNIEGELKEIYEKRKEKYENASDFTIDCNEKTSNDILIKKLLSHSCLNS